MPSRNPPIVCLVAEAPTDRGDDHDPPPRHRTSCSVIAAPLPDGTSHDTVTEPSPPDTDGAPGASGT